MFQEILDRCAFQAFERQNRLSMLVGERDWLLNTEEAIISFGEDLSFPVQFLGTESEISKTWMWADANRRTAFPEASLELCRKVRELGRSRGIEEFCTDHFPFVDQVGKPTGHSLAMVAVSLGNVSAYYRAPHEAGAVFVAMHDSRIDAQPDLNRGAFAAAFQELMWLPGDMKKQLVSYLSEKGYIDANFDGVELNCRLYTGEEIYMSFKPTMDGGATVSFSSEFSPGEADSLEGPPVH